VAAVTAIEKLVMLEFEFHRTRTTPLKLDEADQHRLITRFSCPCTDGPDKPIVQEALAQITWYHNLTLIEKVTAERAQGVRG
jgi:hypothetical protein